MGARFWKPACLVLLAAVLVELVLILRTARPPAAVERDDAGGRPGAVVKPPVPAELAPRPDPRPVDAAKVRWVPPQAPTLEQSCQAFATLHELPTYRIPLVEAAPAVDGEMDGVYLAAAEIEMIFLDGRKGKPSGRTTVRAVSTKTELFVFYKCSTPDTSALRANIRQRDAYIWTDEYCDLFVDPTNSRKIDSFYFISTNPLGYASDLKSRRPRNDYTWNPDVRIKTKIEKEFWTLELALPFKDVCPGPIPRVWAGNFNRMAFLPKVNEDTAWVPTNGTDSHVPERFGYLWLDVGTVYEEKDYAWWTGPRHSFEQSETALFTSAPAPPELMEKCEHQTPSEDEATWFGELCEADGRRAILVTADGAAARITTVSDPALPIHAKWINAKLLYIWRPLSTHEAVWCIYDAVRRGIVLEEKANDGFETWERLLTGAPRGE